MYTRVVAGPAATAATLERPDPVSLPKAAAHITLFPAVAFNAPVVAASTAPFA